MIEEGFDAIALRDRIVAALDRQGAAEPDAEGRLAIEEGVRLATCSPSRLLRRGLMDRIGRLRGPSARTVTEVLKSTSFRGTAILELIDAMDATTPEYSEFLVGCLEAIDPGRDCSPTVFAEALRCEGVVDALEGQLSSEDYWVRNLAAMALLPLVPEDHGVTQVLLSMLTDPADNVEHVATEAVGRLAARNELALRVALRMLEDTGARRRHSVSRALGNLLPNSELVLERLFRRMQTDPTSWLRTYLFCRIEATRAEKVDLASFLLREAERKSPCSFSTVWGGEGEAVARQLRRHPHLVSALERLIGHERSSTRRYALNLLSCAPELEGVPALLVSLRDDPDDFVRYRARQVAEERGIRPDGSLRLATDEATLREAALAAIRHQDATPTSWLKTSLARVSSELGVPAETVVGSLAPLCREDPLVKRTFLALLAGWGLPCRGTTLVVQALAEMLDDDPEVRRVFLDSAHKTSRGTVVGEYDIFRALALRMERDPESRRELLSPLGTRWNYSRVRVLSGLVPGNAALRRELLARLPHPEAGWSYCAARTLSRVDLAGTIVGNRLLSLLESGSTQQAQYAKIALGATTETHPSIAAGVDAACRRRKLDYLYNTGQMFRVTPIDPFGYAARMPREPWHSRRGQGRIRPAVDTVTRQVTLDESAYLDLLRRTPEFHQLSRLPREQALLSLPPRSDPSVCAIFWRLASEWSPKESNAFAELLASEGSKSPRVVDEIVEHTRSSEECIRHAAWDLLSRLAGDSRAVIELVSREAGRRKPGALLRTIAVLSRDCGRSEAALTIVALAAASEHPIVRREAFRTLAPPALDSASRPEDFLPPDLRYSRKVERIFARALSEPEWRLRQFAAEMLGRFPSPAPETIEVLCETTRDASAQVCTTALQALGRVAPSNDGVADVLGAGAMHAVWHVREAAVEAFGRLPRLEPSWAELLLERLSDTSRSVRRAASRTVSAHLRAGRMELDAIQAVTRHEWPWARGAAIDAILLSRPHRGSTPDSERGADE